MTAALRYVSGRCAIGVKVESGNYAPCGLEPGHDGPHKPVLVPPAASPSQRLAAIDALLGEIEARGYGLSAEAPQSIRELATQARKLLQEEVESRG